MDGGSFDEAWLNNGIWTADNVVLKSQPECTFTGVTTVEACFRGHNCGVYIPADRQDGSYGPLIVVLTEQPDGSRTLSLLNNNLGSPLEVLHEIENLADGFVRVQLRIDPDNDTVTWRVNNAGFGTYAFNRIPLDNSPHVSIGAVGGTGEIDYIDIRVRPEEEPEEEPED